MMDETQDIKIVDVEVVEESPDADVEQTVEIVDVSEGEEVVIESEEAFAPLDIPNEQLRHTLLTELEVENQHPIEAIIGLRTELDTINSLKSVYSDATGTADYYEWQDGSRDAVGYFVSLAPHSSMIQICNGKDIFGVTVDEAGFIGHEGFEEVVQRDGVTRKVRVERDDTYALVATSGFVEVRCESDVKEGDYVISNEFGKAQKATSEYGYKVIDLETKHGVNYAVIALGVQADVTEHIGRHLIDLDERMDDAEKNIASLTVALDDNSGAIDELKENVSELQELDAQVQNTSLIAAQAKAIATSAISSAETWRNEAIEKANEALAEAINTRNEVAEKMEQANTKLDDAVLELQETQEELDRTRDNLQETIDDARGDIEDIRFDLIPLESWVSEDGEKASIAGFVTQANENTATLGVLTEYVDDTNEALAGFKTDVAKNYATLTQLAALDTKTSEATAAVKLIAEENKSQLDAAASFVHKDEDGNIISTGLAGLIAQVTENSSELDAVASYEKDGVEGLAGLVAQVDENKSELSTIAGYEQKDANGNVISSGAAGLMAQVDANSAELSTVANYEYKDENGNVVKGSAGLIAQVEENKSDIELLAKYGTGDNTGSAGLIAQVDANTAELANIAEHTYTDAAGNQLKGLAAINQEVTDHGTELESLTSWQGSTNNSLALIKQKADANGASIQLLAANVDKYSVGEYSQAYGFTLEQANDILEAGMVYVPTVSHSETYKYTTVDAEGNEIITEREPYNFTSGNLYTWSDDLQPPMWEESMGEVIFFATAPAGDAYKFWYKNSTDASDGYEGNILYKFEKNVDEEGNVLERWVSVASLHGNSGNRAVSQIRQDTDSIALEVTNARGGAATLGARLEEDKAEVQLVASWAKDPDTGELYDLATIKLNSNKDGQSLALLVQDVADDTGKVTAASIVAAVNDDTSGVTINAEHINLNGAVTISDLDSSARQNLIISSVIEYGLSNSATVAPTTWRSQALWVEGQYTWQRTTVTKADGSTVVTTACIQGAKGEDGTGVTIKGVAYAKIVVSDSTIGTTYVLYSNESCTNQIVTVENGDSYLVDGYLFVYSGSGYTFTCTGKIQGPAGKDGYTPIKGIDYFDGTNGTNGTSIVWRGTYLNAPSNPSNGWAYYNASQKASYVYQDGSWYQMSVDGINGQDGSNGTNGISIVWKGELYSAPSYPQINWVYKDIDDKKVYIYNGAGWELMVLDGSDGADGADGQDGADGLSVFITYNDSTTIPSTPTGAGTTNGWHTAAASSSVWMSQKVAASASSGTWGTPIKIKGENGTNGTNGTDGKSVLSLITRYHLSSSKTTAPSNSSTQWMTNFDTMLESYYANKNIYPYIWSQEMVTYSDYSVTYSTATVNSASATIASWCDTNDKTKINGGNIATGSITASQIAAGSITADKLAVGALTADSITVKDASNNIIFQASESARTAQAGGWTIGPYALSTTKGSGVYISGSGDYTANTSSPIGRTVNNLVFRVGTSGSNAVFGIGSDGKMYATAGYIGGFEIQTNHIRNIKTSYNSATTGVYLGTDGIGLGAGTFYVDSDGYLTATSGSLGGWYLDTREMYCGNRIKFHYGKSDVSNAMGVCMVSNLSNYPVFDAGAGGGISFGMYSSSSLYYQQYLFGGVHSIRGRSNSAYSTGTTLRYDGIYFSYYSSSTSDIGPNDTNTGYVGAIKAQSGKAKLDGTWYGTSSLAIDSARSLKNNIMSLDDKHTVLFDNLTPRQFTYNDGSSNRVHYGLIVDELKSAMDVAGITPEECAAYCLTDPNDPNGSGGIRYSELIALCIKEIQTLKQKVKELENKEITNE